ncbi:hypothetical protein FP828_08005 [bacterium]|nr:hypothetical protein [bacterium]
MNKLEMFCRRGFFIAILFLCSCAMIMQQPRTAYELKINAQSKAELEKHGLTVAVQPIILENCSSFPEIYAKTTYKTSEGEVRNIEFSVIDIPAFAISITNKTGDVVKFDKCNMNLEDDLGKSYQSQDEQELNQEIDQFFADFNVKGSILNKGPIESKIEALKLMDKKLIILPNKTEDVFLAFNVISANIESYMEFLSGKKYLKVSLNNIAIKSDKHIGSNETVNFEFIFDVNQL